VLPLIAFSVAGLVLSTQFSNTHASGGGDRSDAAQVAALGVWCGVVATGVLAVTWLGRAGLLKIAGRILRRA